ncbi:unnamed protein product [Bursaphelenchus xylophilus]|uniref:(pine wood nematode) hypothetical protein n=1 Tax=Bursaphelenchus xylophilus TaxID=6326 RepID=A0A1I7RVJ1_BURXY|nr:unnamed protein product [Bursaphelenchus xylophilus]CAG9081749.1 unnamed protein product [Bursaphelenchus xylophilus]
MTNVTLEECADAADELSLRVFVYFLDSMTCNAGDVLIGSTNYGMTTSSQDFVNATTFMRSTRRNCNCMTGKETELKIADLTYGDNICPAGEEMGFETNTSLCLRNSSSIFNQKYYNFRNSIQANLLQRVLNRSQATKITDYYCDYDVGFVTLFDGAAYCYMKESMNLTSSSILIQNGCASRMTNSTPVTFFHPLVRGLLVMYTFGKAVPGVVRNGKTFTYWDNSTVPSSELNWMNGYPTSGGDLVRVDKSTFEIYNTGAVNDSYLSCIGPALKRS